MKIILFTFLVIFLQQLSANDSFEKMGSESYSDNFSGDFEEHAWKEETAKLPDLPDEQNLIPFPGVPGYTNYEYLIDEKSLSVGKEDAVVRFIIVIKSSSGAFNSYYQGINCESRQIKSYAYAHSSAKELIAYLSPTWKSLGDSGAMGYSKGLADSYLCNPLGGVYKRKAIISNLKYGSNNDGFQFD